MDYAGTILLVGRTATIYSTPIENGSVLLIVHLISFRRMLSIGNNNAVSVVRAQSTVRPSSLDGRKHSPSSPRRDNIQVRCWVRSSLKLSVEWSCKAGVVEDGWVGSSSVVIWSDCVACNFADQREDIGTYIPAAEGVEVPVCFNSAEFGVVVLTRGQQSSTSDSLENLRRSCCQWFHEALPARHRPARC